MAWNCIYLDFCCVNWLKLNHVWFCFLNRNSRCSTWRVQRKSLHLQPTLKTAQMTRLSTFLQRSVYADILLPPVRCVFLSKVMYFLGPSWGYFPVMFYSRPVLKPKGSIAPRMTDSVNRILFIHLIQNGPFSWTPGIVNRDVISFLCVCWISFSEKPKAKRFTTAKAPLSAAINIEELMSPSEDEHDQEEDEWRPEKPEKCRRTSKKTKAVGVRVGLRPGGVKPVNSLWLQGYVMNAMCFLFVSVCV